MIALLALLPGLPAVAAAGETLSDGRYVMGTVLEITLEVPRAAEGGAILEELFGLAAELDRLLTVHAPDSPVSRLNRSAGRGPMAVRPEIRGLLLDCIGYSKLTRGSFDVTVGSLVRVWSEAARRGAPPADEELRAALARVGPELIRVGEDGRVALAAEGVSVDLGGIAKGYALDRMRELLGAAGASGALLNFGGSSVLGYRRPSGQPGWRLLLQGASEAYAGVVTLRDLALSVSGSLGQWSEIAGTRYGHVLDPRTGRPLTRALQAAVVAPGAARAEALSKALLILGEEEGIALLEAQPHVEGLLLDASGGRWATRGWRALVAFDAHRSAEGAGPE